MDATASSLSEQMGLTGSLSEVMGKEAHDCLTEKQSLVMDSCTEKQSLVMDKEAHEEKQSYMSSWVMGKEAHDCCMEKESCARVKKVVDNSMGIDKEVKQRCVMVNGPIIVGAGPSGLATAACLKEEGVVSLILEKADCVASLWQRRSYDRLKLHLPKQFCELPLMPFPSDLPRYPTKEQFVEYLESYAQHFDLQPRFNECVLSASFDKERALWRVCTMQTGSDCGGSCQIEYMSRWLVVATGENAEAVIPDIMGMKSFKGSVIHASEYKNGSAYKGKSVLVVGCGNSAMELSLDLCDHNANPSMVVRNTVHVLPREIAGMSTFGIAVTLGKWFPLWVVDRLLLTVARLMFGSTEGHGLRRPAIGPIELKSKSGKTPVLDVGALALIRKKRIKVVPAVKCFTAHGVKFVDGQEIQFDSVILATGYNSNVPSWLKDSDFFTEDGMPRKPFPNGWKGENGLFSAGFTRRGLLGAALDARNIARDVGVLRKELELCCRQQSYAHKQE
ncbi:hypothetical protein SUGI_0920720 [Cryptomeria japonica]|uniref:probable indole-3-pyruvate monooxygenase YUCCA5 n=1 Tax=Cryptomeria japonica TaxID=3369 RepID=UPI002414B50B|nr:probable indole-3-pyruvate monooxygenase YUCCA5 [Cryptomeria japonica]GLJ44145.1 hypothetical protein SUGI_0920720 [Cryptomeria japonica]